MAVGDSAEAAISDGTIGANISSVSDIIEVRLQEDRTTMRAERENMIGGKAPIKGQGKADPSKTMMRAEKVRAIMSEKAKVRQHCRLLIPWCQHQHHRSNPKRVL